VGGGDFFCDGRTNNNHYGIVGSTLYPRWRQYRPRAQGTQSPQLIAAGHELARHDDPQCLVRVLKTEPAYGISAWPPVLSELRGANPFSRLMFGLFGWQMKTYGIGLLDFYSVQIRLAARPWVDARKQIGHADGEPKREDFGVMADLLLPALQATYDANARNLAVLRSLRIFNALRQYAAQHGHEARWLENLTLPKEATIDPFSGEPLSVDSA
jgi:hypothetical protein